MKGIAMNDITLRRAFICKADMYLSEEGIAQMQMPL